MISLEQVKLLESRVAKAIDYIKQITEEKKRLAATLQSYQKRIEELEVLVQRFKDDQGKIEAGILAALDRLNQFEDAIERSLAVPAVSEKPAGKPVRQSRSSREAAPVAAFSPSPPAGEVLERVEEETEIAEGEAGEEEIETTEEEAGEAELDIF
jgi:septal ring factor EnvC (AmiA/AmiB activator)